MQHRRQSEPGLTLYMILIVYTCNLKQLSYVCPSSDFQQSTTATAMFPPLQPVEQSPQSVVALPLPLTATMTTVPVSGDQSNEYSALNFVLPDSISAGIC